MIKFQFLALSVLLAPSLLFGQAAPGVFTDLRLKRGGSAAGLYSFHHDGDGVFYGYDAAGNQTSSWDAETGTFTGIIAGEAASVAAGNVSAGTLGTDVNVQDGSLSANVALLDAANVFTDIQKINEVGAGRVLEITRDTYDDTHPFYINDGFYSYYIGGGRTGVANAQNFRIFAQSSQMYIDSDLPWHLRADGADVVNISPGSFSLTAPASLKAVTANAEGTDTHVFQQGATTRLEVTADGVEVTGVTQTGGVVKGFEDITGAGETLTMDDYYFQLNPSLGNQTVTLPAGAAVGTEFRGSIINWHATNTVSFDAGTDNIHAPGFFAATPYTLPDSTAHRWVLIFKVSATVWSIDTGINNPDGSLISNLNASNLASGTIPDARFPAILPAVSGENLTGLSASNVAGGTFPVGVNVQDANLSANVALLNKMQTFSGDPSGVSNAPLFRRSSSNQTALRVQGNFSAVRWDSYAGGGSFDLDVGSDNAVSSVRVSRNVINDPAPVWLFYPGNNSADVAISLDPVTGDISADGSIAVGGNISVTGLTNTFGRIILTNGIRQFNTTGGRMDFNLGNYAQIGTGEYRFGSEVDTGASTLFSTWYKGDNTVTQAMQLNHKSGNLTLNGNFDSETITANAPGIEEHVFSQGGVERLRVGSTGVRITGEADIAGSLNIGGYEEVDGVLRGVVSWSDNSFTQTAAVTGANPGDAVIVTYSPDAPNAGFLIANSFTGYVQSANVVAVRRNGPDPGYMIGEFDNVDVTVLKF